MSNIKNNCTFATSKHDGMKIPYFILITCCCLFWGASPMQGQELIQIKKKYRKMLIPASDNSDTLMAALVKIPKEKIVSDQMVQELMNRYPFDLKAIEEYVGKVRPDGSFSDIDYQDTKRSGWQPKQHAERVLELCKLYESPTTPYYHRDTLRDAIHQLIDFWIEKKPKCLNWWYNQIGVPRSFGQAFLLFEDHMTEKEKQGAIEIMKQSKFGMTGQNKVWEASNVMIRGLLQNDEQLVREARDTIFSEIRNHGTEGIQPDWSYQLHGPQLQFGNYGMAFLSSMAFFYQLFQGTSYQMSDAQTNILTHLINDGFRWTIWHRQMDINALGRQLFHNGSIHKGYCLAFAAEEMGIGDFPLQGNDLIGHKHFSYSDYTVHRMANWMASLRMSSSRTIGSEYVNEDNALGNYMGDGGMYIYTSDNAYMDALPIWDWRKIPGVTAFESSRPVVFSKKRNNSNLVGGISDGCYGMSAMEYDRDGVKAHKCWIFTPEMVLCLGSGIQADSSLAVTTCMDQRLAKGQLTVFNGRQWRSIEKAERLQGKERFLHHSIGYIPLERMTIVAEHALKTGSWSNNMRMYPFEEVQDTLMTLVIHHGVKPKAQTYAYAILPQATSSSIVMFKEKDVDIVQNTNVVQMVTGKALKGRYWAVFYRPASLRVKGKPLSISQPGIYCMEQTQQGFRIIKSIAF